MVYSLDSSSCEFYVALLDPLSSGFIRMLPDRLSDYSVEVRVDVG